MSSLWRVCFMPLICGCDCVVMRLFQFLFYFCTTIPQSSYCIYFDCLTSGWACSVSWQNSIGENCCVCHNYHMLLLRLKSTLLWCIVFSYFNLLHLLVFRKCCNRLVDNFKKMRLILFSTLEYLSDSALAISLYDSTVIPKIYTIY